MRLLVGLIGAFVIVSCGSEGPETGPFGPYDSFEDCLSESRDIGRDRETSVAFCEDEVEYYAWEAEHEEWLDSTTPEERYLDLLVEMGWTDLDETRIVEVGYQTCSEIEHWGTTQWGSDPGPAGQWVFYRLQMQDSPDARPIVGDALFSALVWLCPELSGADEDLGWAQQVKGEYDAVVQFLQMNGR